jgi:tetratricopeptide (TPR) repeat protein
LQKGDPEYLDTMTWLAHAYTDKRQYEPAQALYKSVLEIRRGRGAYLEMAVSLENLARYYNNLGQLEDAANLYNEALDLRRKSPGSNELIAALREVANFEMERGEADAAIKLYEEALVNQEKLEPDDPNIAETFTDMARVYELAGESKAEKKREERLKTLALQIRTSRLLKGDSNDRVNILDDLTRSYIEDGRLHRADQLAAEAQEITVRLHGPESQETVDHLITLAEVYRNSVTLLRDAATQNAAFLSASARYQQAIAISKRRSFVHEELRALDSYAGFLLERKDFTAAERVYRNALEIRERNSQADLFPEHMLIETLNGLAQSEAGLGKASDAEARLLAALKVFDSMSEVGRNSLGGARGLDPYILRHSTSARLAELYRSQGKLKEADERYRPLAEGLKTIRREYLTGEYTASSYLEIIEGAGRFYAGRGDVATAESFYRLVWPADVRPQVRVLVVWPEEVYAKTIMALAPVSCVDSMIRILHSYETLLAGAGRQREADEISHGVARLEQRKSA